MSRQALPLITPRLTLRAVQSKDKPLFFQLYSDWQVTQYLLRTPAPFTQVHAQTFVDTAMQGLYHGHTYALVIELSSLAQAIGLISLRIPSLDSSYPEAEREEDLGLGIVGYSLLPSVWGRRLASESVQRVVQFAFDELKLDRIQASSIKTNVASRRLLERIGFTIVEADILEEPLHGGTPQLGDCYMLYRSQASM